MLIEMNDSETECDDDIAQAWTDEVLSRSAAYKRGEKKAVDWREALDRIEAEWEESLHESAFTNE